MMDGFSELYRQVLEEFKESTGHLRALLERFCELKADEYRPRVCSTWRASRAPRKSRPTMRSRRRPTSRSCASYWRPRPCTGPPVATSRQLR